MSKQEEPAPPASAEDTGNNPSHLLIILAPPSVVTEVTETIHYKDLAVIGASPVENADPAEEAESAIAMLAINHLQSISGQVTVHVVSFSDQNLDPDKIISHLDDVADFDEKLDFQTVPLESVPGLVAYLEEFVRLTPEDPSDEVTPYRALSGSLQGDLMDKIAELEGAMGLAPLEDEDEDENEDEAPVSEPDSPPPVATPLPVGFCWVTRKHVFNVGEISRVTYEEDSCVVDTAHFGQFELRGEEASVFVATFLR